MSSRPRHPRSGKALPVTLRKASEQSMKPRASLRGMRRRAARGHPLWWVLAGIVVGIGGTAAAFWRSADDEPERRLGMSVPGYLSRLASGAARHPASVPASGPATSGSD